MLRAHGQSLNASSQLYGVGAFGLPGSQATRANSPAADTQLERRIAI